MTLTDEQFRQDVDYSIGSLRNHYVHLTNVDGRWLARLKGTELPTALTNEELPTRELVRSRWEPVANAVLQYAGGLEQVNLDDVVHYDMPHRGGMKSSPRWHMILQIVNHGTDHRSQMLPILQRLGAPTFEQDLIFYLWEH